MSSLSVLLANPSPTLPCSVIFKSIREVPKGLLPIQEREMEPLDYIFSLVVVRKYIVCLIFASQYNEVGPGKRVSLNRPESYLEEHTTDLTPSGYDFKGILF